MMFHRYLSVLILLTIPLWLFGAKKITVISKDNSVISIPLNITNQMAIQFTNQYGTFTIPIVDITNIAIADQEKNSFKVFLKSGDVITVWFYMNKFTVYTKYGNLDIDVNDIKKVVIFDTLE